MTGRISPTTHLIELIRSGDGTTAIFAAHDEMAIGALRAIDELGIDISGWAMTTFRSPRIPGSRSRPSTSRAS